MLAQTSVTGHNRKQDRRRWLSFQDFMAREVPTAVPGEIPLETTEWLTTRGASLTSPDSLDTEDLCLTCRQPGPWIAEGCSLQSGAFGIAPVARLDPTRWKSQVKHAMKCKLLRILPLQAIKQDHVLRGVMSETAPTIFWVGADGASMLDRVAGSSGRERMIEDNEGARKTASHG